MKHDHFCDRFCTKTQTMAIWWKHRRLALESHSGGFKSWIHHLLPKGQKSSVLKSVGNWADSLDLGGPIVLGCLELLVISTLESQVLGNPSALGKPGWLLTLAKLKPTPTIYPPRDTGQVATSLSVLPFSHIKCQWQQQHLL